MGITTRSIITISLAFGMASACGDKSEKESIELANEAVGLATNQKNYKQAEKLLEESTAKFRDNHNAWYLLGHMRDKMNDFEGAIEAYGEAARVKDSNEMYHYKLGKAYWLHNNASQAEASLERAVQLNPKLFNAQYQLGLVYEKQGKIKQAAEAWTAAANLNPRFGKPFNMLGQLYMKWEKLSEAIGVLEQGCINVLDAEDLTNINYNLGMSYEKQGNLAKAIEAYTASLDADKTNADALRQRGFTYAATGDKVNATKDLNAFVEGGGGGEAFQLAAAHQHLQRIRTDQ
ncbi:MAG: tetratricopeptide repeat protein [Kofleriaceae bacterium]|nr:tetratricopeptide repeat protein [Kofleriaceae bacterium]